MEKAIVLCGIKHCGKSTHGRILAERLGCPFFDTDEIVAQAEGQSPREIYLSRGAEAFMRAEARACRLLAEKLKAEFCPASEEGARPSAVIATGGGICNNEPALDALRPSGILVFLETSEKAAADRIIAEIACADGKMTGLPAYIAEKSPKTEDDVRRIFSEFYRERCAAYRRLADVTCLLDDAPTEENAKKILEAVQGCFLPKAEN